MAPSEVMDEEQNQAESADPDESGTAEAEAIERDTAYCLGVEDFFKPAARFWMAGLLQDFLDGRRITPTELLHLPHWQKEFSNWHLRLTFMQKAATAQTRSRGAAARARFQELLKLEEQVGKVTAQRGRTGEPPVLDGRAFNAAIKKLYGANPGFYGRFDADSLLAHYIRPGNSFSIKVEWILRLCDGEVSAEALAVVDQVLGEIVASPAASMELFQWVHEYRGQLELLTDLWMGTVIDNPEMPRVLEDLGSFLRTWDMPVTRRGLEITLQRLLLKDERLAPITQAELMGTSGLLDELVATGVLAAKLKARGSFIGGKRTAKILDQRVSHLLSEDKLEDLLRGKTFYAKLVDLFNLDQAILGEYSQGIICSYLQRLLDNREFSGRLLDSTKGVRNKLRVIADVQQRIGKSSLPTTHKNIYARMLDEIQHTYIRANNIFGRFSKDKFPSADEVIELATLVTDGSFTEDKCINWARDLVRHHVRTTAFIRSFLTTLRNAEDRAGKVASLNEKLSAANLAVRDISKLRVLLAEDEDAARSYMEMILRDLGVTDITLARDGQEALEIFSGHEDSFDLIICDWKMPRLSGVGFLKQVRAVRPNLPYLMVTALATLIAVEEAMAHDVTAYIAKPFPPEQLEEKVLVLINRDRPIG